MTYDLQRFVSAQDHFPFHGIVLELAREKKTTHWIWFVFPQWKHLGQSVTAKYYGLETVEEAEQYLEHPVLGQRLCFCALIMADSCSSAEEILGPVDAKKFRTCMEIFAALSAPDSVFHVALARHPDPRTASRGWRKYIRKVFPRWF